MRKELDRFYSWFASNDEFISFLEEREKNTTRIKIPAKDLRFLTIGQAKKWYKTDEALASRLELDEELIRETEKNTNIIVVVNNGEKNPYLLGDSSWVSIKNRIDIYGRGFDFLPPEEKVRDINTRLSQLGDEEVLVIVVDKKIRAIMSRMYAVVVAADLFKEVLEYSRNRFEGYDMVEAYADHNITRCKILFTELKEELISIYKLPDEYIPGLIIQTSDTGYSANRIGAYWQTSSGRESFVNSNEYIYVKHKGKLSLDDILEELPNLFIKYQNTLKKFAQMLTVEINQPVRVLKKACKHIGVAKKYTKMLVDELERELATLGTTTTTAYDICRKILSLPNHVEEGQKTDVQEKVGKAININYDRLEEDDE